MKVTSIGSFRRNLFGIGLLVSSVALVVSACGEDAPDATVTERAALTGTLTLSGVVSNTTGSPVSGVKVTLNGAAQASATTDAQGKYSFSVNPGAYSLSPSGVCTSFEPGVVNLGNISASNTAINFFGSGGTCGPAQFSGGLSGSLTLSGHVTSGGHAVAGIKVTLAGATTGFRFTDETGAYSFLVNPGSYSLKPTGSCSSFTPDVVNLGGLTLSKVQDFTGNSCK